MSIKSIIIAALLLTAILLATSILAKSKKAPQRTPQKITIEFSEVPSAGAGENSSGDIGGKVSGANKPSGYKIVIYSQTNVWWVQPTTAEPFTNIDKDGEFFASNIHLGHHYAAILVEPGYKPRPQRSSLPKVGDKYVIAVAKVPAANQ